MYVCSHSSLRRSTHLVYFTWAHFMEKSWIFGQIFVVCLFVFFLFFLWMIDSDDGFDWNNVCMIFLILVFKSYCRHNCFFRFFLKSRKISQLPSKVWARIYVGYFLFLFLFEEKSRKFRFFSQDNDMYILRRMFFFKSSENFWKLLNNARAHAHCGNLKW